MNFTQRFALRAGFLIGAAALAWPLAGSAQDATAPKAAADQTLAKKSEAAPESAPVVVLSPFTVTTDKDRGYAATNSISGSRVNTPIKDIPIPIHVITSEFINDIGATDLRQSLSYVAGITLQSQNDLENTGATFGSVYGPGGVNNPEGVTSNINQVQVKIRGFITNNTLRDGFLRGNGTDSVNIERVEVVSGPNALLYGTGNFGGVVDYLTKQPQNRREGTVTASYGSYSFMRTTLDVTGPVSLAANINYRLAGAWESSETNIDFQKNSHYFLAPSFNWRPTPRTEITVEGEYGRSKQNGYSFRALRAAQGNSATPINNDQLEAVSFYFPPGADKRTFNLGGPDTYNDQQQSNLEIKATQLVLRETDFAPEINFLIGYNHSKFATQTRNIAGQITGPILAGQPGFSLAQTIVTLGAENGLGGQSVSNGNLLFGTLPSSVVKYAWNRANNDVARDQERVELTFQKSLFEGKWYQLEEQVLAGYSEIRNDFTLSSYATVPGSYSYKKPLELSPIMFGKQGDGSADPAMYQNDRDNINLGWDSAYYANSYLKIFKFGGVADRVILMNGIRRDKNNNWSTDTTIASPTATPATISSRAAQVVARSHQNGVILKLTKEFSLYGLKSEGFQPNFGTLHNATTGTPVGADTAKSREIGVKFDLLDGKISGTISRYKVTKTGWSGAPWYAPAPLGHIHFDPTKPVVYNLNGGFNGNTAANPFPGVPPSSQGDPVQTDPVVVAAWNAAVAAGAVTANSPITGQRFNANSLYLNATNPAGAAYMDAVFAGVFRYGGAWPGWPYQGNSDSDPNINNATLDAAGFQNTSQNAAYQVVDQAEGWDGTLLITPNDQLQIMLTASIRTSITRLSAGQYPKYPYPQDRWASWYFPNGGFGLVGSTLAEAYTTPSDTSTHKQNLYPGDDTPKNSVSALVKYKFDDHGSFKGLSIGLGGNWRSERVVFSGITHGAGQAQYNTAGQLLVLTAPSQYLINGFVNYEWKSREGLGQYVQVNADNVLNDTKLYGLIYQSPFTAKISYGLKF
ncbi:MAG: fhuA 8 [Verrucomicrobia bacterium]|nr:fhuA 8 [Verrucomicrobiota bacterium]